MNGNISSLIDVAESMGAGVSTETTTGWDLLPLQLLIALSIDVAICKFMCVSGEDSLKDREAMRFPLSGLSLEYEVMMHVVCPASLLSCLLDHPCSSFTNEGIA